MPGVVQLFTHSQQAPEHPGLVVPQRLFALALDLIFPPRCYGCGRVDAVWCDRCQQQMQCIPPPAYVQPLPPLSAMASTAVHDGLIQQSIWSLKYDNARALAVPLGSRLAAHLRQLGWPVEAVVPVPMHAQRLAERGYNQAQLLAEQLAEQANLLCLPAALRRWRFTPSQVGLGREARLTNVQDAFEASPDLIQQKTLVLIDDVYTTGATLSACAQTLLQAGAAAVYGLTVSAARHSSTFSEGALSWT